MTIAEQDNIRKELTDSGELIFEPGYVGYLRSMNYKIRDISDIDTVQSESNPDKKYLVAKIETFDKQQDHPDLDYVADKVTLHTCSCWDWRSNHSADLENENPSECGDCKHLRKKYKTVRANADNAQETL